MVNQNRAVDPVQEIVDGISGARQTQRAVNRIVQRGRVVKVNVILEEVPMGSSMRPAVRSITADVEVRSPSGRVATIMGMLCTIPIAVGMLVACQLPSGSSGDTGVITGRALPPAAQTMQFQRPSRIIPASVDTPIASWVSHEVVNRPTPPAPTGLSTADASQYTTQVNALRQDYRSNDFTRVFGQSVIGTETWEPAPLIPALSNIGQTDRFVVSSEVMRFQTIIDFQTFRLLYAISQNESGYISEVVGDTSRTTTVIGRKNNRQPGQLQATLALTTEILDGDTVVDSRLNSFHVVFSRTNVSEVPVESTTVSGDPIRTGTTSSHVERIIEMTAFENEHELDITFSRMGQYMGQTLSVRHYVEISFGSTAIDSLTGYLGTIPADSIFQSGVWGILMRETGYGSALNESETAWVEENVTP